MPERPPEDTIAAHMVKAMVEHTIDDISYGQMSRIAARLNRLPTREREAPIAVGRILVEELGEQKALQYVEKAMAGGLIKAKDYDGLRAAILLSVPREKIPAPWAGIGSQQLLAGQRKLQEQFGQLDRAGKEVLAAPFRMVNKDIERMRHSWGL